MVAQEFAINNLDRVLTLNVMMSSGNIVDELIDSVCRNTSIDWQYKESVQAKLRVLVKRILRKYKYPPDDPATGEYTESVNKVLTQAEMLADFWTKNI